LPVPVVVVVSFTLSLIIKAITYTFRRQGLPNLGFEPI
jgi:hypothetical protein